MLTIYKVKSEDYYLKFNELSEGGIEKCGFRFQMHSNNHIFPSTLQSSSSAYYSLSIRTQEILCKRSSYKLS